MKWFEKSFRSAFNQYVVYQTTWDKIVMLSLTNIGIAQRAEVFQLKRVNPTAKASRVGESVMQTCEKLKRQAKIATCANQGCVVSKSSIEDQQQCVQQGCFASLTWVRMFAQN